MEKTLTIDGRQVTFEARGSTPLRYNKQFGTDFFADLLKMRSLAALESEEPSLEEMQQLDTETFFNICWAMAKTHDNSIPEPLDWLDTFDEFPLFEVLPALQDLLTHSMKTESDKKK